MDLTRVAVPTETLAPTGETNAYVVGDAPAVLVDPAARTADLDALVEARAVGHVVCTHTHRDHVGAVAAYARETGATVWARRGYADRFADATGVDPDRTFAEGTAIPCGDDALSVLDTPGHAPDHVAFVTPAGIISGDLAVAEGSVVVAAPEGDMRAYLVALRRLRGRATELHPGHGPEIDDPWSTLDRLLSHRLQRERRVLAAVRDGARSLDDVLDAAYDKDVSHVRDLAAATVAAHLDKLAVEGRIEGDGDAARPA